MNTKRKDWYILLTENSKTHAAYGPHAGKAEAYRVRDTYYSRHLEELDIYPIGVVRVKGPFATQALAQKAITEHRKNELLSNKTK